MRKFWLWMFRKTLETAMKFAVRAMHKDLASGRVLQVQTGRRVRGVPYEALFVFVDANVVKIHDAQIAEVNQDKEPLLKRQALH